MGQAVAPAPAANEVHYERRRPEETTLYQVIQEHLESFLVQVEAETGARCTYRIALGPRAGHKVLSLQTVPSRATDSTQPGCVNAHGFSLHAPVRCGAHQRKALERLCR